MHKVIMMAWLYLQILLSYYFKPTLRPFPGHKPHTLMSHCRSRDWNRLTLCYRYFSCNSRNLAGLLELFLSTFAPLCIDFFLLCQSFNLVMEQFLLLFTITVFRLVRRSLFWWELCRNAENELSKFSVFY